ncbi:MAG: hypothetical protein ACYC7L_06210 [Nitrospirota bacterium]
MIFTVRMIAVIACLVVAAGCVKTLPYSPYQAEAARGSRSVSPQLESVRAKARSVAVVPAAYAPKVIYHITSSAAPMADEEVAKATLFFTLAALALRGGIYHAKPGPLSDEQTAAIVAPLRKAIADRGLVLGDRTTSHELAQQVAAASSEMTDSSVTVTGEAGPGSINEQLDATSSSIRGADMALVVRINEIGFSGVAKEIVDGALGSEGPLFVPAEKDPQVRFGMTGTVTVVRIPDEQELLRESLVYFSDLRRISEWAAKPEIVKLEMENAVSGFKRQIADNVFLLYELKTLGLSAEGTSCPLERRERDVVNMPLTVDHPLKGTPLTITVKVGRAGSIRPVLAWEAFPRFKDREEGPKGFVDRISDVTYDLKVWNYPDGRTAAPVYERTGIKALETWKEEMTVPEHITEFGMVKQSPILRREGIASHKVEIPLEAAAHFLWTVRARFKLDGKIRVTRWSRFGPCYDQMIEDTRPHGKYFRFVTPAADDVSR